ncbi:Scr1 family TA system antitoxin-like transcriptional regulator [Streptomyces harbinensis]|uniref:Scr1 family TA system antitoxin-like transcriptional regulator n=1 Tax=Streptomyces harbinensis TaxID=1176198 RepID=UPI0034DFED92
MRSTVEVGRCLLGAQLLRLRTSAGLRQRDVVVQARVALARLRQVEHGQVMPDAHILSRLLRLYRAGQEAREDIHTLLAAIPPGPPQEADEPSGAFCDAGSGRWERLTRLTNSAQAVTEISTGTLPPRVQIAEYAIALVRGQSAPAGADISMALTGRCGAAASRVVVTEPVLSRTVGGRRVMAAQLDHLMVLATHPGPVTLRIIPTSAVPHTTVGTLRLLHLGTGDLSIRVTPSHVAYHPGTVERAQARRALSAAADSRGSAEMIRAAGPRYGVRL